MSPVDFLLELYCLVDEQLKHVMPPQRLRPHGPQPALADAEVITMELAGEFWGHDQDKDLFAFFRRHHLAEFPRLAHLHRSSFVRQAANLWQLKARLWQQLLEDLPQELHDWWSFDSFPLYVCAYSRAPRCRLFAGRAAYGYDHQQHRVFYGFKLHLRCGLGGAVGAVQIAPADPFPVLAHAISHLRQGIETVIGQLAERFNAKWTWTRDRWHLCHRTIRKMLAHIACVSLNVQHGHPPLQLDRLLD